MRAFFLLSILFFSCSGASRNSLLSPRPDETYPFSILQGSTDETSTVLRLVYPGDMNPIIKITNQKNEKISIAFKKEFTRASYNFKSVHLGLKNLNDQDTYTIKVSSQNGRWNDERTFRSLKDEKNLRVLVASCLNDNYNEIGNKIWPQAFSHDPDVVFLIGDNIYADTYSGIYLGGNLETSPAHLWKRYVDHAMKLKIYRLKKLVPTFVTWDDHDYGKNNGGRSYKYKKEAKKIFHAFFPMYENQYLKKGWGVGSQLELSGQNFLFLDGRYYREGKSKKNGEHLGKKQTQWLLEKLKVGQKLNWLIKGDQFFGGYHPFESFEGDHPETFKRFLSDLKSLNKRYVFLSGDRHLVEVIKVSTKDLGRESMEYTVSGVHTKVFFGALKRDPNERRQDGFDNKPNYALFDIENTKKNTLVTFKAYFFDKEIIHRTDSF